MNNVERFVDGLAAIPMELVELLQEGDVEEVTPVMPGNVVEFFDCEDGEVTGVVDRYDWDLMMFRVKGDNGQEYVVDDSFLKVIHDELFPKNDFVWVFKWEDELWAYDHYKEIANCGFRIYEVNSLVVIAAEKVDDMYKTYWNGLYKERMRGLA